MDGAWCQKKAGLRVSLGIPAMFVVSVPHDMSQFNVKAVSFFALLGFLKWHFL